MKSALKLAEAAQAYRDLTEDAGFEVMERLERLILDHKPQGAEEAALMLEQVGENLEAGGRSDGRDLAALQRVVAFLRRAG